MPKTIPAAGEAMPAPVPTIYDVQIRLLELSTLLETLDEFAGEIHFDSNNSEEVRLATRVMNLASIASQFALAIDSTIDDLIRGKSA